MDNYDSDQRSTATKELLEGLYKNVKMGENAINELLPLINGEDKSTKSIRDELSAELCAFRGFAEEIRAMLLSLKETPKEESVFAKIGTKISVGMNTAIDKSASHLSEMMIQGATMGFTDARKLLREYENRPCAEEALSLARRIIKYEEGSIERLKSFL